MKHKTIVLSIFIMALTFAGCVKKKAGLSVEVNWEEFLNHHDMVWENLKYTEKPDYWETRGMKHHHGYHEGAFTGNGEIGTMIYKESPDRLRFQLGRYDVNSHRVVEKIDWQVPRLLIGDFLLQPQGEIEEENMRLHLWNAEVTGKIETDKGEIEWRSFTHAEDMSIMIELIATGDEKETVLEWRHESGISPRWQYSADSANLKVKMPPKSYLEINKDASVSVQKFYDTGEYAIAWKVKELKPGHKIYYISIENSYPENTAKEKAIEQVLKTVQKPFDSYVNEHRKFWHNYYPQSFVSLPDKKWEGFYWIQMYKLASATRADRNLIDNSGPWLPVTPWGGVWWNLNVQLSYSPLYTSNRLNIAESLINQINSNKATFMYHNVPDSLKDKNCALVDRNSDLTFKTDGKFFELGNFTWILQTMWRQYSYSADTALLKEKIYPLLKANINSYLHFMYMGEDNKLHLPPSHSPEYGQSLKVQDANYALALFRWGCKTLIEANEILGYNDEQLPKWKYVLENLVDAPIDENGYMVGHEIPFAMSHRHYSHLFNIYPLYLVDSEDPANHELINKSIRHWISYEGALAAYSYTGASSMLSAQGEGDKALEYLEGFMPFLCPNTMYVEAGQVIETPLSCAQSINDMLLQSWNKKIRVFPSVSSKWKDVSFDKLLAEGAFEISASRKNGKTEFVKVKSLAGSSLKIKPNIDGNISVYGPGTHLVQEIEKGVYTIDIKKGEEIIITPENSVAELLITPVAGNKNHYNYFGSISNKGKVAKHLFNPE